jgi:hypothetical protein
MSKRGRVVENWSSKLRRRRFSMIFAQSSRRTQTRKSSVPDGAVLPGIVVSIVAKAPRSPGGSIAGDAIMSIPAGIKFLSGKQPCVEADPSIGSG